jgi:hypothetical protein
MIVPPMTTIPRSTATIRKIAFRVNDGSVSNRLLARPGGVRRDVGAEGSDRVTRRAYGASATAAAGGAGIGSADTGVGRPSLMSIDSSQRRMLR